MFKLQLIWKKYTNGLKFQNKKYKLVLTKFAMFGKVVILMIIAGGVYMKNINMYTLSTSFSRLYVNNSLQRNDEDFPVLLQNKVNSFKELLVEEIKRIKAYLFTEAQGKEYWKEFVEELIETEEWLEQTGNKILFKLIEDLKSVTINKEKFNFLNDIIDNQTVIAKNFFSGEASLERVDIALNYIKESPYYLKYDLDVESLPKISVNEVTIITVGDNLRIPNFYVLEEKRLTA